MLISATKPNKVMANYEIETKLQKKKKNKGKQKKNKISKISIWKQKKKGKQKQKKKGTCKGSFGNHKNLKIYISKCYVLIC